MHLSKRRAELNDLPKIIELLLEDELGIKRESLEQDAFQKYQEVFEKINIDSNQYLMVVENNQGEIVGTCHLTLMPSLTFIGATRMQIEAVRVSEKYRGQKIGNWMMNETFKYAKENNASIVQLTTNKSRAEAKKFYENLGFKASHEGMKLNLS